MAMIFCDGCDSYTVTADLLKKWSTAQSPWAYTATGGRNGGGGISCVGTNNTQSLSPPLITLTTAMGYAFYFKINTPPSVASSWIYHTTAAAAAAGQIQVQTNGTLRLLTSAGSNVANGPTNICDNQWHWLEFLFQEGTATNKCFVDGIQQWNSSIAMGAVTATTVQLFSLTNATQTLDDILIFDSNTGYPATSDIQLTPREIVTLRPNGDSAVQFTPNTGGTNYTQVNEQTGDGDTSYVQDSLSGDQDLYNYADISGTPTIGVVVLNSYVEDAAAGSINFNGICKSNATQTNGTSTIANTSYSTKQEPFAVDPNTGAAWTQAGLNAALFGIRVA